MHLFLDYLPYFINNNHISDIIQFQNRNLHMDINSPLRYQTLEK